MKNAKKSKCWDCKHGLCISETETEKMFHHPAEQEQSQGLFQEEQAAESDEMMVHEIEVEHERVKAVCFWKPADIVASPPILVAHITQCSRYEKR